MSAKKQGEHEYLYFPERLQKQLSLIPKYPLTVVEAPSGFGKTTAVREFLNKNLPHAAHEYWYTCLGEPAAKAWRGLCDLFANIDRETAECLLRLNMPTLDTLADVAALVRQCRCNTETYFIIDNYQLIKSEISVEMTNAFSVHGNEKLHIIFITQQFAAVQQETVHNPDVHVIPASAFFFSKENTMQFFRQAGIKLHEDDLETVHKNAEGWVSAIRLQMISYRLTGVFLHGTGIDGLVETAIWNRLSELEKDFLLSVSILDSFTQKQALIMMDEKKLPSSIDDLLRHNALIPFFSDKNAYYMHSILQDFLRARFYNSREQEYQKRMLHRAAEACVAVSDFYSATQLYLQLGDYDAFLRLPEQNGYMNYQREKYALEPMLHLVENCSPETLRKYPMTMVVFAFQLFFFGQHEQFGYLCKLIGEVIANPVGLCNDELQRLQGEMAYIQSFREYNNIEKMSVYHKKAFELLGGPSGALYRDDPWTFGGVSVIFMYWSKVGELERELDLLGEALPYYIELANGHGTGADSVFRAEILFMRGQDNDAEAMCHKALYLARSKHQVSLCLCAELVLAQIAVLRGNAAAYRTAIESIAQYGASGASIRTEWYTPQMIELCFATLHVMLGDIDTLPDWLCDMDVAPKRIFSAVLPYSHNIYSKRLLLTGQYNELYGLTAPFMDMSERMHYLLPQVYHLIFLSLAKQAQEQTEKAREYLNRALAMALPDKVYMPFAEHGRALMPLLQAAKNEMAVKDGISELIALCIRQEAGMDEIKKSLSQVKSVLTPREREIALLTKDGLSAKDIAAKLFITEGTVRTITKNIYAKLGVHSKLELVRTEI